MSSRAQLLSGIPLPSRLLANAAISRQQDPTPRLRYILGHPGRPAKVPTLVIAVFDNSGSVVGPAGTDPLSNRFGEVKRAFSVIARKGSSHELGAVLHFDTPSSGEVGPVPLTRRGLLTLRSGLREPWDGAGSSELAPSLRRAIEIAKAHPDHKATLVVLSDFYLMDPEPGQVLSELAAFPGDVHAVVLGPPLPTGLLDERITVTRIRRDDPPGALARAIFASLTTHRPGARLGRASQRRSP